MLKMAKKSKHAYLRASEERIPKWENFPGKVTSVLWVDGLPFEVNGFVISLFARIGVRGNLSSK
jgi:hypothetical protein